MTTTEASSHQEGAEFMLENEAMFLSASEIESKLAVARQKQLLAERALKNQFTLILPAGVVIEDYMPTSGRDLSISRDSSVAEAKDIAVKRESNNISNRLLEHLKHPIHIGHLALLRGRAAA